MYIYIYRYTYINPPPPTETGVHIFHTPTLSWHTPVFSSGAAPKVTWVNPIIKTTKLVVEARACT